MRVHLPRLFTFWVGLLALVVGSVPGLGVAFGQSEDAPGSLSGWDIEVTDHTGGTVLLVPISDLQQNMKRKQAA